ncbi:CD109 antigen isoform X2 [Frankliniella occidentalis]|uniref:TEP1-F n=1 Tax=Frankliniella occidentalis TaxID=133901 RepID=A0A6J1RX67_FRAOC|nr:CD109 antigen isoform X2 [Frankliniella occidentalis]
MKAMHTAVWVLGAVLAVAAADEQSMRYTVLAPLTVRPNSEYAVAVSMHDGDKDTTVHLELVSRDDGVNRTYSQDVVVPPNSSRTARLQVGELGTGKIVLSARGGEGDGRWFNSTELTLGTKNASLFIQTDKAQYKPGQGVRIRVLALDPRLRPTVQAPLEIYITDGKGNRIKQWASEHTRSGIWSTVLQLSEQPVLGDWTVTASLAGSPKVNKVFSVAEYVLPTFETSVKAPSAVAFKHGKIVVTVNAKYTYGKPVAGKATVKAALPYYYVYDYDNMGPVPIFGGVADVNATTTTTTTTTTTPRPPRPSHIEKTVPIDGTATVEFDITEELKMKDSVYWNQVQFEAWVVEGLTGRRQNASGSASTQVRKNDFDLEFVDSPHQFSAGELVIVKVKVADLDGAPVQDDKNPVKLEIRRGWSDNQTATVAEKKLPSNGIVSFEIETKKDVDNYQLVATYKESDTHHYMHLKRQERESEEDLHADVSKETVKVGDEVEVRVKSTQALQKVTLLVIGPLGVREIQTLSLQGEAGKKEASARFTASDDMVPASRVLVHGVKDNGELITDVTAFKVTGFTPEVQVRVDPGRSEPGRDVMLQVAAKPNATVALLAVDQSVLLLKEANNVISLDDLRNERLSYESTTPSPWGSFGGPGAESLLGSWRGWDETPEESFKKAGLAYLTNAKIPRKQQTYGIGGFGGGVAFASAVGAPGAPAMARPEMAIRPMAASVGAGGAVAAAPPRLRTLFPETWLWQELDSGADGNVSLKTVVPDTITSWVISAFAVDPVHGLGLSNTTKLTVFRPFFASLSLPYSVIRGETVEVPVLVFNYMDEPTTATVTMDNKLGEFDFVEPKTSQRKRREADATSATRTVEVPAQGSAGVSFNITTKKVGNVMLKVTALAKDKAGDAVERPLKVKAEGEPQYRNKAIPIDLRKEKEFKTTVKIDMPGMVPDSDNVEVSAIGDILGPTTANLDSLIRMPYGCGEQNMLNFVPNIVISKYLKRTRRSTALVESQARSFSEIGYQKEMTYRHKDGSFSAFGESDKSGSTWLTAFVAKSFEMARSADLVQVEPRVVDEALTWLAKQQAENGSFPEVGTVSHRDMQGGAAKGLALTAYVLTAFLQGQDSDSTYKHQDTVKKTLEYLVANLDGLDDPYSIAITTHALHVAGHPAKDKAFKLLQDKASTEAGHRFWSKPVESDKDNPYWSQPNSVNVEMTAYALMTYVSRGLLDEALPIMQWLVSQRNSNGGFASTQDTVVGLQALASMAELISFPLGDMRVQFKYADAAAGDSKGPKEATMVVNSKTSMVFQKEELPRHVREVEVAADGAGFALAQVSWSFNEDTVGKHPLFNLKVDVDNNTATNLLALRVCSSFIGGRWGNESNMAVVEVTLPSGFTADEDALSDLKANALVRRVETKDQDTVIVLYFDKMETKDYCVDVSAIRTHLVSNQKPVPVTVYDYYDQSRRARVFYEAPPADLGDKQH